MNEMDSSGNVLRLTALNIAIASRCGDTWNSDGMLITDYNRIIEAAKVFEAYLKGE